MQLRWIRKNEEANKITRAKNVNHSLVMVGKLVKISSSSMWVRHSTYQLGDML